ncbi:hypothetical protein CCACVL1_07500 [Corchorus capsularis]|uniref:Uncharacterized protein n=1 Tax=Corchorus capsularis TaxID=210143 RepID=A0A1R3J5S4_COCAP|nr:hypothetical protein CCACVL1_07500 [Corchorus capsularis]
MAVISCLVPIFQHAEELDIEKEIEDFHWCLGGCQIHSWRLINAVIVAKNAVILWRRLIKNAAMHCDTEFSGVSGGV